MNSKETIVWLLIILLFFCLFIGFMNYDYVNKQQTTLEDLQNIIYTDVSNMEQQWSHIKELQEIIIDNQQRIKELEDKLNVKDAD